MMRGPDLKPRKRTWRKHNHKRIIALATKGLTPKEIAGRVGADAKVIRLILHSHGLPMSRPSGTIAQTKREAAKVLRAAGWLQRRIGIALGVKQGIVSRWVREP